VIYASSCTSSQPERLSSLQSKEETMAKLIPVESSMIQAVGYDPETRILEVVFNSGQTYCYEDVPPEVHQELMAADSKGQYMRAAIIDVYPDYRVSRRRRR
jgi:KTSC domain